MNDYELIYLIQTENDQYATNCLFKKYEPLILKYMSVYKIRLSERDDFLSEGFLMLERAVETFDERYDKTFTRYFELLLKHRFWRLITKSPNYLLCEDLDLYTKNNTLTPQRIYENSDIDEKISEAIKCLTDNELEIYNLFFVENMKIKEICQIVKKDEKRVYNALFRIKNKLKKFL